VPREYVTLESQTISFMHILKIICTMMCIIIKPFSERCKRGLHIYPFGIDQRNIKVR